MNSMFRSFAIGTLIGTIGGMLAYFILMRLLA